MDRHRSDEDDHGHEDVAEYRDQQPGGSGDDGERGAGAPGQYGYRDPAGYPEEQPGGSGDG
jgi:hypothetical protein